MRWLLFLLGLANGTVLYPSETSGLILRVSVPGKTVWAGLEFKSSASNFWAPRRCPATVVCLSERHFDHPVVTVGAEAGQPISIEQMTGVSVDCTSFPAIVKYLEVAGVVAVTPLSDFARSRVLVFSERGGDYELRIAEPIARPGGFPTEGRRWTISATLALDPTFSGADDTIEFDFSQVDTVLSRSLAAQLSRRAWQGQKAVFAQSGRLHMECGGNRQVGQVATTLPVRGAGGSFQIPLLWASGRVIESTHRRLCPVSARTGHSSTVSVGRSLLATHVVSLDAVNKKVLVDRRGASMLPLLPRVAATPLPLYLKHFSCADVGPRLTCRGTPVANRLNAHYALQFARGQSVWELIFLAQMRPSSHLVPGRPYGSFDAYIAPDGSVYVEAVATEDGAYEFVSYTGLVVLRFGFQVRPGIVSGAPGA
jgi:hypothetical protein